MKNLGLLLFFVCFILVFNCFAQEQITITTYYPSPYGVYDALEARRMIIGQGASTGNIMPTVSGVVNFEALAGYNLLDNGPSPAERGMLYYNATYNHFRYFNGTVWVPMGACLRRTFTKSTGWRMCPAGLSSTQAEHGASGTGFFLCCPYYL